MAKTAVSIHSRSPHLFGNFDIRIVKFKRIRISSSLMTVMPPSQGSARLAGLGVDRFARRNGTVARRNSWSQSSLRG